MLGVVGGAVGGGILGGLNASGAVDTVLTVEFGAVFGVLVGVLIAVVLALASRLLAAHRHPQSATSQPSEPGRADTSGLAALGNTVTAHVSVGEVEVRSRLVNLLEVLEHEHAAIEAIGHPSLDETLAAITRLQGEIVAPLESLPPPGGNGRHA
jgi:hypothetical protein